MGDRTIVYIIREDAPQQVSELGVVLNRFLGFVRIRYLERVRGKTALRSADAWPPYRRTSAAPSASSRGR
ncbi:hypothetical protein DIPPA_18871 [Diplonema papillatum]|nr:hypothetical protein DIPPA_18871 [Diplonema papillatum]